MRFRAAASARGAARGVSARRGARVVERAAGGREGAAARGDLVNSGLGEDRGVGGM